MEETTQERIVARFIVYRFCGCGMCLGVVSCCSCCHSICTFVLFVVVVVVAVESVLNNVITTAPGKPAERPWYVCGLQQGNAAGPGAAGLHWAAG